jgi:hypothetical protein
MTNYSNIYTYNNEYLHFDYFGKIAKMKKENKKILFDILNFFIYLCLFLYFFPTFLIYYKIYNNFYYSDLFNIHLKYLRHVLLVLTPILDIYGLLFIIKKFSKSTANLDKYFENLVLIEKMLEYNSYNRDV